MFNVAEFKVSQKANQAQKKQEGKVEVRQDHGNRQREGSIESSGKWQEVLGIAPQTEIQQPLSNSA